MAEKSDPIVNSRVFAAPPQAVFAAFRDPARLAQWWGPRGFTSTIHRFDFRLGGTWRFTMRGPDGTAYEMDKQFTEIVVPERIVLRHFQAGHDFVLTMTFAARGDDTELTWAMRFSDPAEAAKVRDFVRQANEENFDRLASHLSVASSTIR
jgi:uncharacterized protein YndB with AHSA1/START domain